MGAPENVAAPENDFIDIDNKMEYVDDLDHPATQTDPILFIQSNSNPNAKYPFIPTISTDIFPVINALNEKTKYKCQIPNILAYQIHY